MSRDSAPWTFEGEGWKAHNDSRTESHERNIVIESGHAALSHITVLKEGKSANSVAQFFLKSDSSDPDSLRRNRERVTQQLGDIPRLESARHVVVIGGDNLEKALKRIGTPDQLIERAVSDRDDLFAAKGKVDKPGRAAKPRPDEELVTAIQGGREKVMEFLGGKDQEAAADAIMTLGPWLELHAQAVKQDRESRDKRGAARAS